MDAPSPEEISRVMRALRLRRTDKHGRPRLERCPRCHKKRTWTGKRFRCYPCRRAYAKRRYRLAKAKRSGLPRLIAAATRKRKK